MLVGVGVIVGVVVGVAVTVLVTVAVAVAVTVVVTVAVAVTVLVTVTVGFGGLAAVVDVPPTAAGMPTIANTNTTTADTATNAALLLFMWSRRELNSRPASFRTNPNYNHLCSLTGCPGHGLAFIDFGHASGLIAIKLVLILLGDEAVPAAGPVAALGC